MDGEHLSSQSTTNPRSQQLNAWVSIFTSHETPEVFAVGLRPLPQIPECNSRPFEKSDLQNRLHLSCVLCLRLLFTGTTLQAIERSVGAVFCQLCYLAVTNTMVFTLCRWLQLQGRGFTMPTNLQSTVASYTICIQHTLLSCVIALRLLFAWMQLQAAGLLISDLHAAEVTLLTAMYY